MIVKKNNSVSKIILNHDEAMMLVSIINWFHTSFEKSVITPSDTLSAMVSLGFELKKELNG